MKKILKLISKFSLVFLLVLSLTSCKKKPTEDPKKDDPEVTEEVDYAKEVKLDMSSETKKQEASVHLYVDGDTTHFKVPTSVSPTGILKARYLAINTPESTGSIEEWGKEASLFTRSKLESAVSIYIESDDNKWNIDSTGGRYLVWIWYKTSEDSEYRNLNIEILQNGLAIASNSANNRYGEICMKAIKQAKDLKYNIYSGKEAPGFYYGGPKPVTLKALRTNIKEYENVKVAFEGVVTKNYNNSIYVEEYDAESELYYGMTVYLGYNLSGDGLNILSVGNRVKIVGTVQYYEAGGSYQVSGLKYRVMKPDDPENIQLISSGHEGSYTKIEASEFNGGKRLVEVREDEMEEFAYANLILYTTVIMENLKVKSIYTTTNEESSSKGAMTLTCEVDGVEVTVRTIPLYQDNKLVTSDEYKDKVIDVKGIVEFYDGNYQIKVFNTKDIIIH